MHEKTQMVWCSERVLVHCVVCVFFAGRTAAGHRPDKTRRTLFAWNQTTLFSVFVLADQKSTPGILYARYLTACSCAMKSLTTTTKTRPNFVNKLVNQLYTDNQQIIYNYFYTASCSTAKQASLALWTGTPLHNHESVHMSESTFSTRFKSLI